MARAFKVKLFQFVLSDFNALVQKLLDQIDPNTQFSGIYYCDPRPIDKNGNHSETGSYTFFAHFTNACQSGGSRKRTESIFIVGRLRGGLKEQNKPYLDYYATGVSYCRISDSSSPDRDVSVKCGYHFDFDCSHARLNHPIFHAQLNIKAGLEFFDNNDKFTYVMERQSESENRLIRIPTPPMDIFSTVIMLLADHVVDHTDLTHHQHFLDFLKDVDKCLIPFELEKDKHDASHRFIEKIPFHVGDWYPTQTASASI